MSDQKNKQQNESVNTSKSSPESTGRQEQSDPQLTELRGFTDSSEDLEPTLTDGSKAPDKANKENRSNGWK
jgi:hypothetical protein